MSREMWFVLVLSIAIAAVMFACGQAPPRETAKPSGITPTVPPRETAKPSGITATPPSRETAKPSGITATPLVSDLFFAAGVTDAGEPVDVATEFPGETTIVYAFASYEGMSDGAQCESVWYLDGEKTAGGAFDWVLGESGMTWIANIYNDSGLNSGRYDWELYVEGELVATGHFSVRK